MDTYIFYQNSILCDSYSSKLLLRNSVIVNINRKFDIQKARTRIFFTIFVMHLNIKYDKVVN